MFYTSGWGSRFKSISPLFCLCSSVAKFSLWGTLGSVTRFHTPGWQGDRGTKVMQLTHNIQEGRKAHLKASGAGGRGVQWQLLCTLK